MSGPVGTLSPVLLASLPPAVPLADPLSWLSGSLAVAGLLAMGLLGSRGGGDEDDESVEDGPEDDFLGGEFGGPSAGDGGFDDGLGDDGDDPLDEVEPRLDDLEAELADLASTVTTVHGEHESMRESVEDIEENVRKLLEVYEIVTQGANPFADDVPEPADAGSGAFGLFADDEESADPDEAVESLFDDVEEGGESDDLSAASLDAEDGDAAEEGLSFEDLKSEVESAGGDAPEGQAATDDGVEDGDQPDAGPTYDGGVGFLDAGADDDPAKPYLVELPDGYGAELLVMEWLHFLVSASSMPDAMRAIRYYRTVEWIGEEVAGHLQSVLAGMTPGRRELAATDGGLPTELSVDEHTRSLDFIAQLGDLGEGPNRLPGGASGAPGQLAPGGEDRGVQR